MQMKISKNDVMQIIEFFKIPRSINEIGKNEHKGLIKLLLQLNILKRIGKIIELNENFTALHLEVRLYDTENPKLYMRSIIFRKPRENDKVYVMLRGYESTSVPVIEKGEFNLPKYGNKLVHGDKFAITSIQFTNPVLRFCYETDRASQVLISKLPLPYFVPPMPEGQIYNNPLEERIIPAPITYFIYYQNRL